MLNPRDQAEGLRRILMPAKACPIKTLSARLAQGKGHLLQDLVKDIHGRNIHFIDMSLDQVQELPLALLNEHEVVIKLAQSSGSIKQAFGIIKLLAKSPENRTFGIIVSAQNAETAKTVFRNIKHASRPFSQIRLEFIGFSTLSTNWVSPVIMDPPLASTQTIARDPIFTPQFGIAATQ
ncbi:MinD/ParA family protein [Polynucleobacter paneuropaeus]|jgi:MinD-like ATPase involved in chromosome partitioning or flagellar assembly|nr:MinD/ParA family protein [Polynucleobacter paneuropaeus]QWD13698.1 MinD/ParA family protein [Polynucleobacter paneuropaeus]QWD32936.1 MinD/ParA family protein [Polynucleobacter paneuropaeus]